MEGLRLVAGDMADVGPYQRVRGLWPLGDEPGAKTMGRDFYHGEMIDTLTKMHRAWWARACACAAASSAFRRPSLTSTAVTHPCEGM